MDRRGISVDTANLETYNIFFIHILRAHLRFRPCTIVVYNILFLLRFFDMMDGPNNQSTNALFWLT